MPQRNGYSHITGKKSNKKTGSLKFRMGHLFSRKRQRIRSKEQKMDDRTFNDVASISDYDNSMTESDENQNQNGCHCQHNKAIKLPECRLLETKSETESESEYVSRRGSDLIISKAEDNEDEEESESGEEESEGDEEKIEDEDVEEEREESEEGSEGQEQDLSLIYCSCCTKEESDHECYSEHHGTDDKNVEATGDTHAICDYTNHVTPEYHVTERDHMTDGGPKAELSDSDDSESYHSDTIIEQVADANEVSGVECNITNMEAYQEYDNFADAFPGCDNSIKIQDTAGTRECNPSFTDYKALNDKPVGLVNAAYRLDISGSVYTSQVEQDVLGSVWKKMPLNDKPSGYNPTYPTCAAPSCSNARNQLHPSIHDSPFRVYNKNDTVCKSVSKLVGESSVIETQSTDSDSDRGAEAKLDYFCRSRTSHSSDSTTPSGHEKLLMDMRNHIPQLLLDMRNHIPQLLMDMRNHIPQLLMDMRNHIPQLLMDMRDHIPQLLMDMRDHTPQLPMDMKNPALQCLLEKKNPLVTPNLHYHVIEMHRTLYLCVNKTNSIFKTLIYL